MTQEIKSLQIKWYDLHLTEVLKQKNFFEITAQTGCDVWFTPNWLAPWVEQFGKDREAVVACVFHHGQPVGFLPFVIDRMHPFGLPMRVAQLAGPHPLFGVMRLPILEKMEQEVIQSICTDIFQTYRCDCISLAPISDAFGVADQISTALEATSGFDLNPDTKTRGHTIIRLPKSFDIYLSQLSRNRRNKYRKTKRVLEEDHGVATRLQIGAETITELPAFIASHEAQWADKGKLGHFSDWSGSASFYKEFCKKSDKATDGRLFLQTANEDEIVAGLFCFVAGKNCHALVPSRNANWSKLKLDIGLHAQFERIEALIAEGIEVIDSGAGEYDYKASLKGETVDMHRFLVSNAHGMGRFKAKLLRLYSDALNFLFYRIWYNKIAPQLRLNGVKVGPLWRSWIRTRV